MCELTYQQVSWKLRPQHKAEVDWHFNSCSIDHRVLNMTVVYLIFTPLQIFAKAELGELHNNMLMTED